MTVMNKLIFIGCISIVSLGCKNQVSESAKTETASTAPIVYAYTIENPDNWDRGDQKNVELVLKSLKAWENGDIEGSLHYFADTINMADDYFIGEKISKDSLRAMFTYTRNNLKAYKVDMSDFESVISKDKKDEYVGLWYKEVWTDQSGKTDSVYRMDDVKLVNGKIVALDSKFRHYPKK